MVITAWLGGNPPLIRLLLYVGSGFWLTILG